MSNIHQNDELLRVQDQNYDIVFNYDKHENGGVAVHAEKDGKNHKVNPEYARAALVKKISAGGADPALDNAKSTGGIGWTENGGWETVVSETVTTTIDEMPFAMGEWEDYQWTIKAGTYKVIFNGVTYEMQAVENDYGEYILGNWDEDGNPVFTSYPFAISPDVVLTQNAGTYEITVQKAGDIIHKIDEKYLPEGGGGNNFLITMPSITGSLTQDTIAQLNAIKKFILDNSDDTGFSPTEIFSIMCVATVERGIVGTYNCNLQTNIDKAGRFPSYGIGILGRCINYVDDHEEKADMKFIEFDTYDDFNSDGTYNDSEWTFKVWETTMWGE